MFVTSVVCTRSPTTNLFAAGDVTVTLEVPLCPSLVAVIVADPDRKSTRLNSSHRCISYAVFCLKKKKKDYININFTIIKMTLPTGMYAVLVMRAHKLQAAQ